MVDWELNGLMQIIMDQHVEVFLKMEKQKMMDLVDMGETMSFN